MPRLRHICANCESIAWLSAMSNCPRAFRRTNSRNRITCSSMGTPPAPGFIFIFMTQCGFRSVFSPESLLLLVERCSCQLVGGVASEGFRNGGHKAQPREWLGQVSHSLCFPGLLLAGRQVMGRYENDGPLRSLLFEPLLQFETRQTGQAYIQHQAPGIFGGVRLQQGFGRLKRLNSEASRQQKPFDCLVDASVVVHDYDVVFLSWH